jgi:peptidoglycan/LPS O-acetylase OafA/YrhL
VNRIVAHQKPGRLPGLDVLRCIAILAVLLYHYPKAANQTVLRAASHFGWVGVDLFFVLSGYLVAGQLFAAQLRGRPISTREFYLRRALRILPNYFAVLACYALLALVRGQSVGVLWRHLIFVQNFGIPVTFSQSWSLCIEQHFYLTFPLVIWLVNRSNVRNVGAIVLFLALAATTAIRWGIWSRSPLSMNGDPSVGWAWFLANIYYPTHTRIDGIAYGVGLAALQHFRPRAWQAVLSLGNWLLLPAAVLLLAAAVGLRQQLGFFYCVLSFGILAAGFASLIAAALVPNGLLDRIRIKGIQTLALWSYAIYLTHEFAFAAAEALCKSWRLSARGLGLLPLSALTILGFGATLYYGVERRFIRAPRSDAANQPKEPLRGSRA